jgi:hypothetical protein
VAHLDESTIARFIERRLPEDEVHRLQHHLDDCEDCRAILASLAKLSIMRLADGSTQPAHVPASGAMRGRGDRIDRYVVLDLVGAGAMGAVYAAFDPDLDRKVAVKLLHARVPDGDTRMLREAQALARVAHPNVIGVHDVGTCDGHVFIAMEYVAGTTFRTWVAERTRPWQDIVARGVEAARGLAAAHAVGLVHRDVKPDNILVHDRGVARIGDFGLASSTGEVPARDPLIASNTTFDVQLTAPNTIVGTPAYMAPEQLAGRAASARSDQFGFCATLYEALYATRPYPGTTIEEIVQAMEASQVAAPVRDRGVPKRIRAALVRGLAIDPAARFPTMDDLVDELAYQPWSRRRVAAIALGAVAIVGLTAATMRASERTQPCQSAPAELARVWGSARRAHVEHAIAALGLPFGADTAARVTGALDGYGDAWVGQHRQACEATALHRTQSAALRDRRINCLARRLIQLDAVVSTIVATDRDGARHAVDAARGLPSLAICADPDRLANAPAPAIAADVARITADIARGQAVLDLGTPDKAAATAKTAVEAADRLGYAPLIAAAHDLLGQASVQTGDMKLARDSLERAVVAATRAADEQAEARSLASLALVLRNTSPDGQIAIAHARHALAIAERAKQAPLFEAQIRYANIRVMAGVDHDAVVENYRRGSALLETAASNADTLRVDYQTIDAKLSINPFEALDKYALALATAERAYGPDHPQVAAVLVEMAGSAILAEQPDNARAFAQRAAKILAPYPGDRVELRRVDAKLERDPKLRRPILEEIVRATEATTPRSAQLAFDREELADTLLELEAFREGLAQIDGAVAIWDALYDGQFEAMVTSLVTKAQLHAGLEDWPAVAAAAERANALAEKGGMRKLVQSMARLLLVDSYFRQKRWADALVMLDKAAPSIRIALLGDPSAKALDFYAAACRWELGQDRPANLAKARAALAEVKTSPSYVRAPDALAPFEAWLASKR